MMRTRLFSSATRSARRIPIPFPSTTPPPSKPVSPTFSSLKLHPLVLSAVKRYLPSSTPTKIQTLSAAPLLAGKNTLIAAQTGSGKTLAYLLPLLSRLKRTEGANESFGLQNLPDRPRGVIILPTRELAHQTLQIAKELSHTAKLRVRGAYGGAKRRRREEIVDLLVGTPGCLKKCRKEGVSLRWTESVVIDEADLIMSEQGGFKEDLGSVIGGVNAQYIYVTARIPGWLRGELRERHGKIKEVEAGAGRMNKDVEVIFCRVGGWERKVEKVKEIVRRQKGVMVFCGREKRRRELADVLGREREVVVLEGGGDVGGWEKFKEGGVAVCGGGVGRGLDWDGVNYVVLCDGGEEVLHRGGRIRGMGKVFVLLGKKGGENEFEWVRERAQVVKWVDER